MSTETKQEGEFTLKGKKKSTPKKLVKNDEVIKVDLKNPVEQKKVEQEVTKVVIPKEKTEDNAIQAQETNDSNVVVEKPEDSSNSEGVVEEVRTTEEAVESPIQVIKEVVETEKELKEAIRDEKVSGKQLPENIEKLVSFMEETGGTVEDYVRLNADYSNVCLLYTSPSPRD